MCHTQVLSLFDNQIGDTGMSALASACANGPLPALRKLLLSDNQIGDAGMSALASACANGALDKLEVSWCPTVVSLCPDLRLGMCTLLTRSSALFVCHMQILSLYGNNIGDQGMVKISEALEKGALASCQELGLGGNKIGDAGMSTLASACASGALPALEQLFLRFNQIGNVGMQALAGAVSRGGLHNIKSFSLLGNPGNSVPVDNALRERKK